MRGSIRRAWRACQQCASLGFPWVPPPDGPGFAEGMRLRRRARLSRVRLLPVWARPVAIAIMALCWPYRSLRETIMVTRKDPGHRRWRDVLAAWRAALRHNLPPVEYFNYGLHRPGMAPPQAWLLSNEFPPLCRELASRPAQIMADDKLLFAREAAARGLPVVPVLAAYGGPGETRPFADGPPPMDLIVKPRTAAGGWQVCRWRWTEDGHFRDGGGDITEPLAEHLAGLGPEAAPMIVQPALRPHPGLSGTAAPPVARCITVAAPDGPARLALAMAHWPPAAGIISNGGAGRVLDVQTGRILDLGSALMPALPTPTGAEPAPDILEPDWPRLIEMLGRGHETLFAGAPLIGWDVVLSDAGPRILEANISVSMFLFQMALQRPASEAILPEFGQWLP